MEYILNNVGSRTFCVPEDVDVGHGVAGGPVVKVALLGVGETSFKFVDRKFIIYYDVILIYCL